MEKAATREGNDPAEAQAEAEMTPLSPAEVMKSTLFKTLFEETLAANDSIEEAQSVAAAEEMATIVAQQLSLTVPKLALVIGNARYAGHPTLPCVRRDAAEVVKSLVRCGYEVQSHADLDGKRLHTAIRQFVSTARARAEGRDDAGPVPLAGISRRASTLDLGRDPRELVSSLYQRAVGVSTSFSSQHSDPFGAPDAPPEPPNSPVLLTFWYGGAAASLDGSNCIIPVDTPGEALTRGTMAAAERGTMSVDEIGALLAHTCGGGGATMWLDPGGQRAQYDINQGRGKSQ